MPRTDIPIIGKPTPALLVSRLRDAQERYEQTFHHAPPKEELTGLEGWAQVAWLDQAIATKNITKGLSTYTPPAPYRTFKLVTSESRNPIEIGTEPVLTYQNDRPRDNS